MEEAASERDTSEAEGVLTESTKDLSVTQPMLATQALLTIDGMTLRGTRARTPPAPTAAASRAQLHGVAQGGELDPVTVDRSTTRTGDESTPPARRTGGGVGIGPEQIELLCGDKATEDQVLTSL